MFYERGGGGGILSNGNLTYYYVYRVSQQAALIFNNTVQRQENNKKASCTHKSRKHRSTRSVGSIRIEKHLQCEKLIGLAGGNTKKRGNKKSGESITPIRYNVMSNHVSFCPPHHHFHVTVYICPVLGEIITKLKHSTFILVACTK